MVGFLEVVVVAFVTQLSVLPGEKVQLIIAGLATRYNPLTVVAAAGSAFAGWTVLEIAFGEVLVRTLPAIALDGITAGLFLLFAYLLVRSAPAAGESAGAQPVSPDGGVAAGAEDVTLFGYQVPQRYGSFLPIFVMMAAGEFGDKTQMVTIGLAAQFGAHPGIWAGEMLAIIPVSLANAVFFHRYAARFDVRKAHFAGASLFLFFGLDTVLQMGTGFSVWETVVNAASAVLLAPV